MIKLAFTGDIMLSRDVDLAIAAAKPEWRLLSRDVIEVLNSHNSVVGNLECPVTLNAIPLKETSFKANPGSLGLLNNFDILSIANNHIFDCGKEGAIDTIRYLKNIDFLTCGISSDINQSSYVIKEIGGFKFAFIAGATNECIKNEDFSSPILVNAEENSFINQISKLKGEVDYCFALIHGGDEMISYPPPSFRILCKKVIDAGATSVISHHPHVLGGYEQYNGKFIFYSLGDFVFDGKNYKRRRGGILSLLIGEGQISFELIPTQINKNLSVDLADGYNSKLVIKKWNKISKSLTLGNYNKIYRGIYMKELIFFQLDRIHFLIRNKGIKATMKFVASRISLVSTYTKKIAGIKLK